MKTLKKVAFVFAMATLCWSCNEQAKINSNLEGLTEEVEGEDLGPFSVEENLTAIENRAGNPHGLAAAILSPYDGSSETHVGWSPPSHHTPWLGDWAVDLWKDNGNNSTDIAWSCAKDIYIDATPIKYPGGKKPQSLKARLFRKGNACAWGGFERGGYMQQWEIIATYNSVDYTLGWILYAHLEDIQHNTTGTVVDLSSRVKIGKAFSTGNPKDNTCWGSCHLHLEVKNYQNRSCYSLMPPAVNIETVGIIGGLASSAGHCPDITPEEPNTVQKYEAENANLTGVSIGTSVAGFSGTGHTLANSLNSTSDRITFTVNVPTSGSYPLKIRYYNHGGSKKYQNVSINGGSNQYTHFPASSSWSTLDYGDISLNAGNNTIEIKKSWGWTSIDYIDLGTGDNDDDDDDVGSNPTVQKLEAENATLTSVSVGTSVSGFSGTGHTLGSTLNHSSDRIRFTVNVPTSGSYPLKIRYHNHGNNEKYQNISINSGSNQYTRFPASSSWSTLNYGNVNLNAGNNTIDITKSWGWTNVDYIQIGG